MWSRRTVLRGIGAGALGNAVWTTGAAATTQPDSDTDGALQVSPDPGAFDEPLDVRVTDVPPRSEVTLTARMTDREGREWASFARFEATGSGVVDPSQQSPFEGTYEGTHAMGLVWSMHPPDDTPFFIPPDGGADLTLTASAANERIGQRTVHRRFGPENLHVEEPPDGLVGQLFRPAGEGPFPGVIALHGSGGEPAAGNAIMLAAHGYAVFAPQYFGPPDPLPDQLAEVPVEYLDRCRQWMGELPAVGAESVGLMGGSKGAELALLAGATYDWVNSVVASTASGLVWAGLAYGEELTSSWSIEGEPVPFVETAFPSSVVADYAVSWPLGDSVSLRPTYQVPLDRTSQSELEDAKIAVENIDGPVTVVSGGDDRLWPAVRLGQIAVDRLEANDHSHPVRHLVYEDAGHALSYPHQPTTGFRAFGEMLPGSAMAMGGTPEAYARAARESWPAVLETFDEGRE